jgi:spore coat polysaccharide biosynthesis protein SpsF
MIDVAVAIQIRDGNTRLPGKGYKRLQGKPIYQHMITNVLKCVNFINSHKDKKNINASVYLLVPADEFDYWKKAVGDMYKPVVVIPGEPDRNMDVLERYKTLFRIKKPDFIVRLTGDCPFIPSALINKAVNCAVNHRLDYVSNVDERYRTMPDGFDVEVISSECFLWLSKMASSDSDKEHVTTYIRNNIQKWMRVAVITGVFDTSDYKYSIDTEEDFEEVERRVKQKAMKDKSAKAMGYGIYEF